MERESISKGERKNNRRTEDWNKKLSLNKQKHYRVTHMLKSTWKKSIENLLLSPLIEHQAILHL